MQVYLVWRGCYSDRGVVAVALSEDDADTLAAIHSTEWESCDVEEYTVSEVKGKPDKIYHISFNKRGKSLHIWGVSSHKYLKNTDIKIGTVYDRDYSLDIYIQAKDRKTARKKARDIVAQYMAEREGIT